MEGVRGNYINKVKKQGLQVQIAPDREFAFIVRAPKNPHKKRLRGDTVVMLLLD